MTKTLQSVIVSLVVTFSGVTVVGYLATTQWMGPWTPVRIILLAVLVPVVVFGVLITMPGEGEQWTPGRILGGAAPGVLLGFVGMVLAFSWSRESVRIMAIDGMDEDVSNIAMALDDRSPEVAAHACRRMVSVGPGELRDELLRTLQARPEAAVRCLSNAEGERANSYAALVLERWKTAVLGGAKIDGDACRLPDHIASMKSQRETSERVLLTCVLRSKDPEARVCCANNLSTAIGTGNEFLAALESRPGLVGDGELAADVVSAAFRTQSHSEDLDRELERLGIASEPGRKVALGIACDSIGTIDNPGEVTQHLAASLDDVCKVDTAAIPRGRKTWLDFCDQTEELLEKYEDLAATESLCVGVRGMAFTRAVEHAHELVDSALESREMGSMTEGIARGWALQGDPAEKKRKAQFHKFIDSMESNPNLPQQGRALIEDMRKHGVGAGMGENLDTIRGAASSAADELDISADQLEALKKLQQMQGGR